jgi:tetratricopeptide (TPR) repeat protein
VPLRAYRPDAPEGLERVLRKALQKHPHDRWKSAAAMGSALRPFRQIEGPDASPSDHESSDLIAGCAARPTWPRCWPSRTTTWTNWPGTPIAGSRRGPSPRPSGSSACWSSSAPARRRPGSGQGACRQAQGATEEALRLYDAVLQAEPDNVYALANRAEVLLLLRRGDAARADLQRIGRLGAPADLRRQGRMALDPGRGGRALTGRPATRRGRGRAGHAGRTQ